MKSIKLQGRRKSCIGKEMTHPTVNGREPHDSCEQRECMAAGHACIGEGKPANGTLSTNAAAHTLNQREV
jgi:hypothetical protein